MKKEFNLLLADGSQHTFNVKLGEPKKTQSFFILGLAKAGSTLLNNLVIDICKHDDIDVRDFPGQIFKRGFKLNDIVGDPDGMFAQPGIVYTGFRGVPDFLFRSVRFGNSPKIFMHRDPRDMLVSLYFSLLKSHALPESGNLKDSMSRTREKLNQIAIDEFVVSDVTIETMRSYFRSLQLFANYDTVHVVKYEDIIFDKTPLIELICGVLGVSLDANAFDALIEQYNPLPSAEDPDKHVRQAKPGDYKNKLSRETIDTLNERLRPILKALDYAID